MNEIIYESLIWDLLSEHDQVVTVFENEIIIQHRDQLYGGDKFIVTTDDRKYNICTQHEINPYEDKILLKNRTSLKEAVRHLKNLK